MGGYSNSSGMVEMCTNGVFKAISDCAWTDKNAETVCTQLGLTRNGSCLINKHVYSKTAVCSGDYTHVIIHVCKAAAFL